jgi:hypothetical protein
MKRDRERGLFRAPAAVAAVFCAVSLVTACVPVPYKPAVSIQHEAVAPEGAPAILLKTEPSSWLGDVGKELQRAEPRIVFMDGAKSLPDARDFISLPEAIAALSKLPPGSDTPDYLLGLSPFTEQHVHATDDYMPLFGYTKDQYVAHQPSMLVELRSAQPAEAMDFKSAYSMVVVQFFYGVMTVPRVHSAIDNALVAEVARRLRVAQPQGPIRLLVMFEKPKDVSKEPPAAPGAAAGVEAKPQQ